MKTPWIVSALVAVLIASTASASNVGRRFPSEMRTLVDAQTGLSMVALTTDSAGDAKPYQTHPTWTADGEWIIFRSSRGGGGSQVFLVHEKKGDIIQLTDGPATNTGSLNLSRKEMVLYYMRGGPQRGAEAGAAAAPALPRELVALDLAKLIPDAMAGRVQGAAAYERVIATLPTELRDSGGFAVDADDSAAYWGVTWGPPPPAPAGAPARAGTAAAPGAGADNRREIDQRNTDPSEAREAARKRFEERGRGPGGIRRIDLKTGEVTTVIDVDLRMGHVQTNPWVPGEIIYCHETTGDAPQRMWTVRADGTGNRPLYVETPDEWVTHETVSQPDEVMFNIMGHLPYLRERPTGIAVINLRTNEMKLLGQMEETMPGGGRGGFWHCNGSPDGRWAVGDNFSGSVYVIDRRDGRQILLTTDHKMRPDHTHPIFSPDSQRVLIQSGLLSDGKYLNLIVVPLPKELLGNR
jgi:oligogalacturonide lyase